MSNKETLTDTAGSIGDLLRRKRSSFLSLDSKLRPFDRVLRSQRMYRSLLGVKEIDKPAYQFRGNYVRYNQKYNLTIGRPNWDPALHEKLKKSEEQNMRTLAEKGVPGYTLIDYALVDGAYTIANTLGTDINYPNSGFLSWSPLKKPTYEDIRLKRLEDINEAKMTRIIKKVSLWFGASIVRVAILDRRWVYSNWYDNRSRPHRNPRIVFSDEQDFEQYEKPTQLEDGTQIIPKEMKYVISLGFEMDYDSMKTAPTTVAFAGTLMYGYRTIIQTVASLAEFIRGLGYNAIPSSNETALNVPIAIDSGIGEDARHGGCLMTPEYGPRLRLAKVITDLPLVTDRPTTFGVHEFCEVCSKCAQLCPANVISHGPRTYGDQKNDVGAPGISESKGPFRWINNQERCRGTWAVGGTNCGVCIRVCPWNKPKGFFHSTAKWLAVNGGSTTRRILVKLDDLLGYGEQMSPKEWWGEELQSWK